MELSQEQKETVKTWVEQKGLTPAEVQKKIAAEFNIHFTYLEIRLLISELDCTLKDREPHTDKQLKTAPGPSKDASLPLTGDETDPEESPTMPSDGSGDQGSSEVRVTLDKITRPGAAISGSVTFSNGVTTQWQIDAVHHQLAIIPSKGGARPSNEELAQFQVALQQELRRHGY